MLFKNIDQLKKKQKSFLQLKTINSIEDVDALSELLRYHEHKYYIDNDPQISDYEYDQLYKLLEEAETRNPLWTKSDSPTQRVSSDLTNSLQSVEHLSPMLSLDNTYNLEDLIEFDNRIRKICAIPEGNNVEYLVEPKFDGGSLSVVYENNQLVRAATRGDGIKGEEMTLNARTIRSLPLSADFNSLGIYKTELRGEALIRKNVFEEVNKSRETDGLPLLANPRNAATGVLRVKDPNETASRKLDIFIFQWGYAADKNGNNKIPEYKTQSNCTKTLGELGFKVAKLENKVCKNIQEVHKFITTWAEKRDSYPFELDGMVVKLNDLALQEICGYTSHHPRWAVAYKFQAKQASSTLLHVEFQVGKVGSITPVAKIEPVQLAGVTVSSISLHNEDFIRTKDIWLGDTVLVERAGDVIPYIVKSFPEQRKKSAKPIEFPKNCPSCNTSLLREEDNAAWICPNSQCPAQQVQKLIHHVSKDAMDIDGLGSSLIERFYDLGIIKDMSDIYRLDYTKIAQLEGMGEKSADKLRLSIEKAKANPIHRFLHGLCIHHLGKKISKLIAENLDYVPNLQNWTIENYTNIKDVGPVVGQNIIDFFADKSNLKMIQTMESLGVNLHQKTEDKPKQLTMDAIFSGKTILFTGTLSKMGRKEAEQLAEKNGAKVLSAVSGALNILVVGEDAGSKLSKATKLGTVEILKEDEFLEKVGKNDLL
ncbi:MAG: NAD-dependent DNA ligase LigA [Saprospiraceae bacterium]|nr:NAD-dependent DNA ligase LigA [Saprospiraceae bacterium]